MRPAIGYALWEANRHILDEPALNAVEITFERADDPLRIGRFLGESEFDYVSLHALRLSVAAPEPPGRSYLDAMKAIAVENGAVAVSDHLGFTRDGDRGAEMGHFAPPPFTQAALDAVCRNLDVIRGWFDGLPFFLENIATMFRFRGEMDEAEFLARALDRSGCGWLLDVTNLYANSRNHGFDAGAFLERVLPTAGRVQIHLSGGFHDDEAGMYMDSHSRDVPEEVWALYRRALEVARGKVEAVFIERDQNFPDDDGWRSEVRKARRLAEAVEAPR